MKTRHLILGLVPSVLWGLSYPFSAIALSAISPFALVALRYAVVALPTLFLVRRPTFDIGWFTLYALTGGVAQFGLLYAGIAAGLPAGLASVVIQSVGPFSLILGAVWLHQAPDRVQWAGMAVATGGLALIAIGRAETSGLFSFVLVVLSGLFWAVANIAASRARPSNSLHMSLWACLVPPVPMALLAVTVSGLPQTRAALSHLLTPSGLPAVLSIAFIGIFATAVGFGIWNYLLQRYTVRLVAPLSMITPVTGLTASALILGQSLNAAEAAGSVVVVAGVLIVAIIDTRRSR